MQMPSSLLFGSTMAALLHATGESQTELAEALGVTQGAISRKMRAKTFWSLSDVDGASAHFEIPVSDLFCGPTHALTKLPDRRRAALIGGTQRAFAV